MPQTIKRTTRTWYGIELTLERKAVKGLRLRVKPPDGEVALSIPQGTPERHAKQFVAERHDWILRSQASVRRRAIREEPLTSGGVVRLWGSGVGVQLTHSQRASGRLVDGRVLLAGPDAAGHRRALDSLYRRLMLAELETLQLACEQRVGRRAAQIRLRRMTSRWGTCNTSTGVITLNLTLAQEPLAALEYVLCHELVHLIERGHGEAFRAQMDRVLPEWRTRQRALRNRS